MKKSLPESMRGYGHVKDNNVNATRIKWNALVAKWRAPAGAKAQQVA